MEHQVLELRVLDAALTCIARVGVAKTTLDDVAREAGCARATRVPLLPGQAAAAQRGRRARSRPPRGRGADRPPTDAERSRRRRDRGAHDRRRVPARPRRAAVRAHRRARTAAPAHLLRARRRHARRVARPRVAPAFTRFVDPEHALRLSEWLVRIGLSYLCSPEAADLLDRDRVRALVEDFVLPGLHRPVPSEGIIPS